MPTATATRSRHADLWAEYALTRSDEARNRLVVAYQPLVYHYAERLYRRLPRSIDYGDLVSVAQFALMRAIEKFEPERGLRFSTYAITRIRGAMLDYLRELDWLPRKVRQRNTMMTQAAEGLYAELGRPPARDELRRRLRVTKRQFAHMERDPAVGMESLNFAGSDDERISNTIPDARAADPADALDGRDIVLAMLRHGLSITDALIIRLRYFDGLTMAHIANMLRTSESRISQRHTYILGRLRHRLRPVAELLR